MSWYVRTSSLVSWCVRAPAVDIGRLVFVVAEIARAVAVDGGWPMATVVSRSIRGSQVGTVVRLSCFTSCSIRRDVAEVYCGKNGTLLRITSGRAFKMAVSMFPDESECVLLPGETLTVTQKEVFRGRVRVRQAGEAAPGQSSIPVCPPLVKVIRRASLAGVLGARARSARPQLAPSRCSRLSTAWCWWSCASTLAMSV